MTDPQHAAPRATPSCMEHDTREDWATISAEFIPFARALPDRVLTHPRLFDSDCGGFLVDRLMHSLQTATFTHRDGRDEEYVVCTLLHDIDDTLGSFNHPDITTAVLGPFMNPENLWMVERHGIFQGCYFFHHLGLDHNLREQYHNRPKLSERTAKFCVKYDAAAFTSDYDNLPLSFFEPMVQRVLARLHNSTYVEEGEDELSRPKAAAT